MKKFIINTIIILFTVSLFAYLFFSDNGLIIFLSNSPRINISWLVLGFVCQLINLLIDAHLTHRLLKNLEPRITKKDSILCAFVGQFFSAITPSSTGGQPMQIFVLSKRQISAGTVTSALVQKFIVYQTTIVAYSIISILFRLDYFFSLNRVVYYVLSFGFLSQVVVLAGIFVIFFNQKLTRRLINFIFTFLGKIKLMKNHTEKIESVNKQINIFHSGNKDLYKNKNLLVETYIYTFIQLTATFFIPYCVYRAFYLSGAGVFDMISAQSFITMASSFVPIPGSSGAAEGASSIFLAPFFNEKTIKSAIVLTRIISYYFTIILTAPFAYLIKKKRPEINLKD